MRELMERTPGLERAAILNKLKEGLDSTVVSRFAHEGKVDPKLKFVDVDYHARGRYLDMALKIQGAYAQKIELSGPGGAPLIPDNLQKTLDEMPIEALKLLVARIANLPE